jgi:hypothetical protein
MPNHPANTLSQNIASELGFDLDFAMNHGNMYSRMITSHTNETPLIMGFPGSE